MTITANHSRKVAIIGMSCLFPGAESLSKFWSNIVGAVDCIREVSEREWSEDGNYDRNAISGSHLTYSKRGGFISEVADFDPFQYGFMPAAIAGSDPDQLLALRVAYEAMKDAGYGNRSGSETQTNRKLNSERAELILGRIAPTGAGMMNMIQQAKTLKEMIRLLHDVLPDSEKHLIDRISAELKERLVPCTSDNIPGVMPNILAGRIASKLGFGGKNMLIDAACASSMLAVETAVTDLLERRCDFALTGGVHVNSSALLFQLFCGLGALSHTDQIRPFDELADGTLLGEGIGMICLKRYEDAIADGDRIYATICGAGSSSDGQGGSVLAPSVEGEALAMERAYQMSGISPSTVELLEAHGTATISGDVVEMQAVAKVFRKENPEAQESEPWCAVGSIKSNIGHCQSASAIAGIIKAALALHHKVLPPTINVTTPNTKVDWSKHPCYINTELRPWINSGKRHPRRAAVSASGFGGINGHVVLEEHRPEIEPLYVRRYQRLERQNEDDNSDNCQRWQMHDWNTEIFAFNSSTATGIKESIKTVSNYLTRNESVNLRDLSFTINSLTSNEPEGGYRLAIVASSTKDLQEKLDLAGKLVSSQNPASDSGKGIYFNTPESVVGGKLAFMYPGLGSAYTGMLADLCMHFPEVRESFELVDEIAAASGAPVVPSKVIFPRPVPGSKSIKTDSLAQADFAVSAVLLAEYAIYILLDHLNIAPDVLMGCSTGEFAAFTTGGAVNVFSFAEKFYRVSTRVARSIGELDVIPNLQSIRVLASAQQCMSLASTESVFLNSDLGDKHVIVTGTKSGIEELCARLREAKIVWQNLPISIPYHTPLVSEFVNNDRTLTEENINQTPIPTWSCSLGSTCPPDAGSVRKTLMELFTKPVLMRQTVAGMYEEGVRKFIEVGPNGVLTTIVSDILKEKPHIAFASNLSSRSALAQILHLIGMLHSQGSQPDFAFLYKRREPEKLDLDQSGETRTRKPNKLDLRQTSLILENVPEKSLKVETTPATEVSSKVDETMLSYLKSNERFFKQMAAVQENVVKAFLSRDVSTGRSAEQQGSSPTDYSFAKRFSKKQNCDDLFIDIRLETDRYLIDHAIGGFVSTVPSERNYLMPLMVSLEIMAEAALLDRDKGTIVRIENVKAFKRIAIDNKGVELRLNVRKSDRQVSVELSEGDSKSPAVAADFVIATGYPKPIESRRRSCNSTSKKFLNKSDLYGPSAMFHGPLMQSVSAITGVGERIIEGYAEVREHTGWLADDLAPNFAILPLLLDSATQFVLFYLYEQNLTATALLPFVIESIEFFGSPGSPGSNAFISASLSSVNDKSTEATIEVSGVDGKLWARMSGVNHRRIVPDCSWAAFIYDPPRMYLSDEVSAAEELAEDCRIAKVTSDLVPDDESLLDWYLDYVLKPNERSFFREKLKFEKRKTEWLLGRIAAKDAVRRLVSKNNGIALGPLDVTLSLDERERPMVHISNPRIAPIAISLSHSQGSAVAIACFEKVGIPGIDIEQIAAREAEFSERFLNLEELDFVRNHPDDRQTEIVTQLWSAKEAVFKSNDGTIELSSLRASVDTIAEQSLRIETESLDRFHVYSTMLGKQILSYTIKKSKQTQPHALAALGSNRELPASDSND